MRFKLLVAMVDDHLTEGVTQAAREAGATGCTVLTNARGEGLEKKKTFLGLTLETQRDVVLLLVEEHRARHAADPPLTRRAQVIGIDLEPHTGILAGIDT